MRPFPALRPGTQPGVDYTTIRPLICTEFPLLSILILLGRMASAAEFHVSSTEATATTVRPAKPFKTISAAARIAQPGDVDPPSTRAPTASASRLRAAARPIQSASSTRPPRREGVIKGSEVVRDWKLFLPASGKPTIPNSFFGSYNPYKDLIEGDWFTDKGRPHHTGEVYLNGKSLYETHLLERVLNPQPYRDSRDLDGSTWTWFAESDEKHTYIYANFHGKDPNQELVEINVRDTCFYPDQPGRDYITIRGFRMATPRRNGPPPPPSRSASSAPTGAKAGSSRTT